MMNRREFIALTGASLTADPAPVVTSRNTVFEKEEAVEQKGWQLKVSPTGDILSLRNTEYELVDRKLGDNHARVFVFAGQDHFVGKRLCTCNHPKASRREGSKMFFHYEFADPDPLSVEYKVELIPLRSGYVSLEQRVEVSSPKKLEDSIMLLLPRNIHLPFRVRKAFVPLSDGVGRKREIVGPDFGDEYVFRLAGGFLGWNPQRLAIPMVDEYCDQSDLHITFSADPFFTSYISLPAQEVSGQFNCIYLGQVGLGETEERTVYTTVHRSGFEGAMRAFYETALSDVNPGPDWLHDIAMVDFDYLSDEGKGWYADVNKLTEVLRPRDRDKVLLAIHGWYDYIGRYTYNRETRSLDREWIAFPAAVDPAVKAFAATPLKGYVWHESSVEKMHPVKMSLGEMHRRVKYAKSKGFRVLLYFSDGLNASDGFTETEYPARILGWGGWRGPDTRGRTYRENPLHAEVRKFYKGYMQALLDEYGRELDGFVWDETDMIGMGDLGGGYADRAMMTLVKEISRMVTDYRPELVFLTSDNTYCLVAHGAFPDLACRPNGWGPALFPNYRNIIWSCNWAPLTLFEWTRYGVETFDAPVSISNGPVGDDIGISEMDPQHLMKVLDLFEGRKNRRMELTWLEENLEIKYKGNKVKFPGTVK